MYQINQGDSVLLYAIISIAISYVTAFFDALIITIILRIRLIMLSRTLPYMLHAPYPMLYGPGGTLILVNSLIRVCWCSGGPQKNWVPFEGGNYGY